MVLTTAMDRQTFEFLDERIRQTLTHAWVRIGCDLRAVRDGQGYRHGGYASFSAYLRSVFGQSRQRAYQLIDAASLVLEASNGADLSTTVDNVPAERQVRALAAELPHDQVVAALREAMERGEPLTKPDRLAVHYSSDRVEWLTPQSIIERVLQAFGGAIDCDPCSNTGEPNVPALVHYTAADDGLSRRWWGRVYMNPPYGNNLGAWMDKLRHERRYGDVSQAIVLIPARPGSDWWRTLFPSERTPWDGYDLLCLLNGRLTFGDGNGSENDAGAPFPSALGYFGETRDAFVGAFEDLGTVWSAWNWWRDSDP